MENYKINYGPSGERIYDEKQESYGPSGERINSKISGSYIETLPTIIMKLDEELGSNTSGNKAGTVKVLEEEVKLVVGELSPEDKEKMSISLAGLGFQSNKWKNKKFAEGFDFVASKIGKNKDAGRFFQALSMISDREASMAEKSLKELVENKRNTGGFSPSLKELAGIGSLVGNAAKYGRLVFDIFGGGIAARVATRFGMGIAMGVATVGEAGKEARFMNEDKEDSSRIKDIDTAYDEAMKIKDEAMKRTDALDEKGKLKTDALEKAYQENIPKDILLRLSKNENGVSGLIDKVFRWRIQCVSEKIDKQLEEVDSEDLSPEQKEARKNKILTGFLRSPMIRDFDKAVAQSGVVDKSFMLLRTLEQTGKVATYAMMTDTIVRTFWNSLPNLINSADTVDTAAKALIDVESKEVAPIYNNYIQTVKKGDNVWKIAERQLEAKLGENFTGLSNEKQTYLIDAIKDAVEKNPSLFGVVSGNANVLSVGDRIDLGGIINNKEFIGSALSGANGLTQEQMENIRNYADGVTTKTTERFVSAEEFLNEKIPREFTTNEPNNVKPITDFVNEGLTPEQKNPFYTEGVPKDILMEGDIEPTMSISEQELPVPNVDVENIVTETKTEGGHSVENTGALAEISGSTGSEFLSKDYISKLKLSGAGLSFDRQMAMTTSRSITAELVEYNNLLKAGKIEGAAKHLFAVHKAVDIADKTLGVGVIDRSKIPELKK